MRLRGPAAFDCGQRDLLQWRLLGSGDWGQTVNVELDGATLHVEVDGDAARPPLLLWPPGRCTMRVWDHLVPRLAEAFRVVRIDIRGFGKSSPATDPETRYTLEQYAKDACDVLDHLAIPRCHVWSQSWGSRAAMVFCGLYPERVLSAALYAANLDPADVPAQREGTKRAAEERRQAGIAATPLPTGIMAHADPQAAAAATAAAGKFDLATVVDKLVMPVLIATGAHDPNLTSSRVIAKRLPSAQLEVLHRTGHNGMLEHPELALATFLAFHRQLGDSPAT